MPGEDGSVDEDAQSTEDAPPPDEGEEDSATEEDSSTEEDAAEDAVTPDAFAPDTFTPDARTPDAVAPDAMTPDAGPMPDTGPTPDAGVRFGEPPAPSGDVRQGDRGLIVGQLQFQLKLATGRRLDEDGSFGPATLALLNTFQTSAGLPTGNVANAATRAALTPAASRAAAALVRDYGPLPERFEVPPRDELAVNLAAVTVVRGEGDKTGTYMGRTGFAYGDGAESTGITQGSPAHIAWVNGMDVTESETRVIGTISRNEGPFDAVNSYDAGYYTWGAYQLIAAYRTSPYRANEDELSNGLAYAKELDPVSFWHAFQRYGVDVGYTLDSAGRVVPSSVAITLTRGDGMVLRGIAVWMLVGTDTRLNQVFINAGRDPRIQRTHILGSRATHFDVLGLALGTGRPAASRYLTSERAVACFLDMELNVGRGTTQRTYAAGVDDAARMNGVSATNPDGWPEATRAVIENDVLAYVLAHAPSTRYATRMQRVLSSYFLSDDAHSFMR